MSKPQTRTASIERETSESSVRVTLDLDGFRSGRMNDVLVGKALPRAGEDA